MQEKKRNAKILLALTILFISLCAGFVASRNGFHGFSVAGHFFQTHDITDGLMLLGFGMMIFAQWRRRVDRQ